MLLVSATLISRTESECYTAISLKTTCVCESVCESVCVAHQTSAPQQRNIWHTDALKFQILYFWGPSWTWGISPASKCFPSFSLKKPMGKFTEPVTCHIFSSSLTLHRWTRTPWYVKRMSPNTIFSSVLTKAKHCAGLWVNDDKETHFISD